MKTIKKIIIYLLPIVDIVLLPMSFLTLVWLKLFRRVMISGYSKKTKLTRKALFKVGVFPLINHYYEPMYDPNQLRISPSEDRLLLGIDLNISEQLSILSKFDYNDELSKIPLDKTSKLGYYYINDSFKAGDAEYLYSIIRYFKPKKIIEIGSGNSTLMAINAIKRNEEKDPKYKCVHICIEPYECKWLEELSVKVIRKKVEEVEKDIFTELEAGDILFIDSSHVIRPQGDVLFEYLEILPILKSGVLVHIHDIFSPKDYLKIWLSDEIRFWNEQYLLEAFLSFNNQYRVIGSLNFLKHHHFNELSNKFPIIKNNPDIEPGSFWIIRNR